MANDDEYGERPADHPDDEGDEGEDESGTAKLVPFDQDVEDVDEEDEGET